ncbi:putative flippase [Malaciobacter marinus]|uniref:Putative flippase n=1 Tax=Malaciobacter marinus TaxID=505249 RepID=A0A347TJ65_9BACT|nr:oligosaccharide flippase family protein [Malaciobacter marinus]AXX86643.1 putative flippase [Malaciobacter marinus]PHO14688.1 hypothetical protein CPH92_10450 [Malaciobacter marinus]
MIKNFLENIYNKGFFHLLGSNFLVQFFGFGLVLFLGKILSAEEIGNIKIIQSYSLFFITFATFGVNVALLKTASEKRPKFEKKAILKKSIVIVLFFSIISIFLLFTLLKLGLLTKNEDIEYWLYRYSIVIPFAALGYLFLAYFQALKEIKNVAKFQVLIRLIFIVLIFIFTYLYGFSGLIYSTIISYILGTIIFFKHLDRNLFKFNIDNSKIKKFNSYAFFSFIGMIITVVGKNSDIYLLDYLEAVKDEIGYYSIAIIFFMAGNVINGTAQSIITPHFSENENNYTWLKNNLLKYQILMIPFSIVVSLCLYLLAYIVVNYYYGQEYSQVLDILIYLLVNYLIISTYTITGGALVGLGVIHSSIYIVLISTFSSLLIGYYLFFSWGVYGVAIGQIIGSIVNFILITLLFIYHIKKIKRNYI